MVKGINIYKGNIYRIFVEDVKLNKGNLVPTIMSELIKKDVEFYLSGKYFVTVNGDCMQIEKLEAEDCIAASLENNKDKIIDIISDSEISSKDKKKYLASLTSYPYVVPGGIKLDHSVTRSEFKELRKRYKQEKKKN